MYFISIYQSYSLGIVVFILLETFSLVNIIFGMLFSTFFKKSKTAGAACGSFYTIASLIYFTIFLPRQFDIEFPEFVQYILSLIFPCAFSLAIDQALFSEAKYGQRFSFDLLFKEIRPNTLSIMNSFLMLVIDGVIYFVLALYFDNIIPSEYGRAKSPLFFLNPSFCFDCNKNKKNKFSSLNETDLELESHSEDYEPIGVDMRDKVGLRIRNLVKKFKNEEGISYNAIDFLNLTIYCGQITAILGRS